MYGKLPIKLDAELMASESKYTNFHRYIFVNKHIAEELNFLFSKNLVFPPRNPVHPFPDLTKWDPEDYYDVS
jgi:hypothetical protein